jgi:hypothetical protein
VETQVFIQVSVLQASGFLPTRLFPKKSSLQHIPYSDAILFMFIVVPLPSQALIGMEDDAPVLYSG